MPHERRRHVRKKVDLPAAYQAAGCERVEVQVGDMSPGGALLVTPEEVVFGTKLKIWLTFPDGETIQVDATARWTTDVGVGVQFGPLGARDTYLITEYLADVAKQADPTDE